MFPTNLLCNRFLVFGLLMISILLLSKVNAKHVLKIELKETTIVGNDTRPVAKSCKREKLGTEHWEMHAEEDVAPPEDQQVAAGAAGQLKAGCRCPARWSWHIKLA
jgi:hypothetical protein